MSETESRQEILAKMIREAEEAGLYEAEAELYGIRTIEVGEVNWNATAIQYMKLNKQRAEAIKRVRDIHKPVEYHGQVFCAVCSYDGIPESLAYPCPTIKALDGEQDES